MKLIKLNDGKEIPTNSRGQVTLTSYQKWAVGILEHIQNRDACIALDAEGVYLYSDPPNWNNSGDSWNCDNTYIKLGDVFDVNFDYEDSLVGYEVDNSIKYPHDALLEVYNGQKWIKRYSAGKVTEDNEIYVYDHGCTSKTTTNELRSYKKSRILPEEG